MTLPTPVAWSDPSAKFLVIAPEVAPRPICSGFVPPRLPLGAEPKVKFCRNWVLKSSEEDLKPTVLTLAMLLPTTPICSWLVARPLSAVLRDEVMPAMKNLHGYH